MAKADDDYELEDSGLIQQSFIRQLVKAVRSGRSPLSLEGDLDLPYWKILKLARKSGLLVNEYVREDFLFLGDWSKKLPRKVIAHCLGLTPQAVWKLQSKHKLEAVQAVLTESQAIRTFQFLIEHDLVFSRDPSLPKKISRSHLTGAYYPIYAYALDQVKANRQWFSALGFLAQVSYPSEFRHFQFKAGNHAGFETIDELNIALSWCFEKMTGIDLLDHKYSEQEIMMFLNEPRFGFNADALRHSYLQRDFWAKWYPSFAELKTGLAKSFGLLREGGGKRRLSTKVLRSTLLEAGRKLDNCEVCGETKVLEIHHIFPVAETQELYGAAEVNQSRNLVVLCPTHHRLAAGFDWRRCYSDGRAKERLEDLITYLRLIDEAG